MKAKLLDGTANDNPNLVPLDRVLPDVSSVELARRLGALLGGAAVSVTTLSDFLSMPNQPQWAELDLADPPNPAEPSRIPQVVQAESPNGGCGPGAEQPTATGTGQEPNRQLQRVLVVHDDPVQQKVLKLYIEMLGYKVEVADNGDDGFSKAQRFPPDAIVSDVLMPHLDGFGFCKLVRSDPRMARIPLILVSVARTTSEDRHLAENVGADALLPATPDFAEVRQVLVTCLH